MRTSSFTILMIVLLMIIIVLALIVIIGLTAMLGTGSTVGEETGPIMQFVTLAQEQMLSVFDYIQQWVNYIIIQIQKLSELI
ncbi:MAG: hypothetical protein A4E40_01569 [Methanoregulaceae archaeon PtaU1.Bin059]|nr:MAG: hypothetical protein A4E39_01830 [Methanoregulaceae archaeon PtaB.Bin152]OPY35996.1 MAG: hypothetical protein A4E40_01569 [Methanoregulaceae archaeon PtaU1.Bin059]